MALSPIFLTDFYKTDHRRQYPRNTTMVYSNFTPRISRLLGVNHILVFGIQYLIDKYIIEEFNTNFFARNKEEVLAEYKEVMDISLGKDAIDISHLEKLHDTGFLPIEIKAIDEGLIVPIKTPVLTIRNTHPDFAWLPNFLETLISNVLWHPMTTASIALYFRTQIELYAKLTSDNADFAKWQGHDFSMRGQTSVESSMMNGLAHLTCFTGSDTIPAHYMAKKYYGADLQGLMGSIPATEHSVQCLNGKETEVETYRRLITEVYPTGPVSIVSDTWDYWKVLQETLVELKPEIMARDGKLVIRPDSGNPLHILCGDPSAPMGSPENQGSLEILWKIFGGKINSKGFRELDPHIGLIYGDSINIDMCQDILAAMTAQGFATTNVVFGIGSYSYQYVTRDTFGFAMKATFGIVDRSPVEIYKDPKTDGGVKKSAKGLLHVDEDSFELSECVSMEKESQGALKMVFSHGKKIRNTNLDTIRKAVDFSVEGAVNEIIEGNVNNLRNIVNSCRYRPFSY